MVQRKSDGRRMSRRQLIKSAAGSGALAAANSLPFAPAIGQAKRQDLRVGIWGGDIGSLSPAIRWTVPAGLVMNHIFDGLTRVDYQNRRIIPWLAEDWTNPDPLTWRIKLREGVLWHGDYGEFTAEDVAYTWQHHFDTSSFMVGSALFPIDTIKAESRHVVEVKTKTPFGAFPGATMGYGGLMLCRAAHQEMGEQQYAAAPVGHGPYILESVRGNEVNLVRNEKYWRPGIPKLARINYRTIPDSSIRLQSMEVGEFDFISHPDTRDVARIRENPKYTLTSLPGWNWDYQCFNIAHAEPDAPYLNKLARQAISYAIDRVAIAEEIYNGEARPTDNQIPAGFMGHQQTMLKYPERGDLAKARELIAQAGLSGYQVEVITSDKDWMRRELELVAAMVGQIGIGYRIRNLDVGGFNNFWFNKNFEQLLEDITIVAPDPDATSWWFLHKDGATSAYNHPKMASMLDGARQETDAEARASKYHDIVGMTVEECPMIYHCNVNYVRVFDAGLTGFKPGPQEYVEMLDEIHWK